MKKAMMLMSNQKTNCFEKAKAGGQFFIFFNDKLYLEHECSSLLIKVLFMKRQAIHLNRSTIGTWCFINFVVPTYNLNNYLSNGNNY